MKYLKLFDIFKKDSLNFTKSKKEIDNICHKYDIKNYTINDDFSIDVNGRVYLPSKKLIKLPLKFNKVNGHFDCYDNQLTSLEGCPKEVGGHFNCSSNQLTSLEGCPNYIGGYFYCFNNKLTSLDGCTKEPDNYSNNPCTKLYEYCLKDLKIPLDELNFRLEEFNCFKDNKLDLISLESLYEFYGKEFNENNFK